MLLFRYQGYRIIDPDAPLPDLPQDVRTAVLIPIYNEDPKNVGAGVEAMWRSLSATGQEGRFDVFILSDTTDPDVWVREEEAWYGLRERLGMNATQIGRASCRERV